MNHEHVSLQIHCDSYIPGLMRGVSDGIDQYLALVRKRNLGSATIVVTDDIDFAAKAFESNDIVVFVSSQPESVARGVVASHGLTPEDIREAVCLGCTGRFGLS